MKQIRAGKIMALIAGIILINCKHTPDPIDFVRVEGTKFFLGEEHYCYAGINFWHGAYLGADIISSGRERLVRELDLLKKYGINNLRIMASSEKSPMLMSVYPVFQIKPGSYNEELLQGLDFLLNEMNARKMKAVMVMNNYWQWSGGMAQYVNWATGDSIIDPDLSGNWHGFMIYSAGFYYNQKAKEYYLKYLNHVIRRKNTINHKYYFEDPTIMSWELANEPRPHPQSIQDRKLLSEYYLWIDSAASYIHSLAPYQLVTTGSEGLAGSLHDSSIYFDSHSIRSIDYVTFHLWPKNWGWYKADRKDETLPDVLAKSLVYCIRHFKYAELLNKPTVLEEFGIGRDYERIMPGTSVSVRDTFLNTIYRIIEQNMQDHGPVAGTNVWTWGGEGRSGKPGGEWIADANYTGDPPQEPQGLNSIFDTDTSTLNIISRHSSIIRSISGRYPKKTD